MMEDQVAASKNGDSSISLESNSMKTAELHMIRTSAGCISYRLVVDGRTVWSNRTFADVPASHEGARGRLQAWARAHGYWVVERKEDRKRA